MFCVVAIVASWAISASAQANVYCVPGAVPGCTGNGNLQDMLDAALINPGPDQVRIASGPLSVPSGNIYSDLNNPGNSVEISGSGDAQSVLTPTNTTGGVSVLTVNGPPGTEVRDITITMPDNESFNGDRNLVIGDETVARNVLINGPLADNVLGIQSNGGKVIDSTVDLPNSSEGNAGIFGNAGDTEIINSMVRADRGVVNQDPGGSTKIVRSQVDAVLGASGDAGTFNLENSVVRIQDSPGASGVQISNANNGSETYSANLDGTTIIGPGGANPTTGIRADADSGQEAATVDLTNSVITGTSTPLDLESAGGHPVTVDTNFSAYDVSGVSLSGPVTYSPGAGVIDLPGDPLFTAPSDLTPAPGSPLIDTGDPADPPPGATDFTGINQRACHGTIAGVIRRDIGAFEYKTDPADDCTYPETTIVSGPEPYPALYTSKTLEFGLASDKPGSTFRCWVDNAPETACGPGYTTPEGLSYGYHGFAARAIDVFGNVDQTPVRQTFGLYFHGPGPTTCRTDPELCPLFKDVTAPKVLKLKAPKKTRKKRVKVRFRSNENKVIFTCKLNHRKATRCKSPWKTPKLKKGKNVVRVWVTDSSGNKSGVKKRVVRRK